MEIIDKEKIKKRIEELGLTQSFFAKKHRRKVQQITQALNGSQPGLLKKIIHHIEKLESRQSSN